MGVLPSRKYRYKLEGGDDLTSSVFRGACGPCTWKQLRFIGITKYGDGRERSPTWRHPVESKTCPTFFCYYCCCMISTLLSQNRGHGLRALLQDLNTIFGYYMAAMKDLINTNEKTNYCTIIE